MHELPWKIIVVPADGRCTLHATAVACGYRNEVSGNNVCMKIKSEILEYYKATEASKMIQDLFESSKKGMKKIDKNNEKKEKKSGNDAHQICLKASDYKGCMNYQNR